MTLWSVYLRINYPYVCVYIYKMYNAIVVITRNGMMGMSLN